MFPGHLDGRWHIVRQNDELGRPPVTIAAKCDDECLSHSGGQIATCQARVKTGAIRWASCRNPTRARLTSAEPDWTSELDSEHTPLSTDAEDVLGVGPGSEDG